MREGTVKGTGEGNWKRKIKGIDPELTALLSARVRSEKSSGGCAPCDVSRTSLPIEIRAIFRASRCGSAAISRRRSEGCRRGRLSARRGDATRPDSRQPFVRQQTRGLASMTSGHEIGISNPTPAIGRFHQGARQAATTSRAQAGSDRRIGHVAPCGSALEQSPSLRRACAATPLSSAGAALRGPRIDLDGAATLGPRNATTGHEAKKSTRPNPGRSQGTCAVMRERIRIQPYLSRDLRRKLRNWASAQNVTESAVTEAALAEYLDDGRVDEVIADFAAARPREPGRRAPTE